MVKCVEIRDRGTFIPAMGIRVTGDDGYLLRRAGFGDQPLVLLVTLNDQRCSYDPFSWGRARTMQVAHLHLQDHWDEVADQSVVCVEFLLGERDTPKVSERETVPV